MQYCYLIKVRGRLGCMIRMPADNPIQAPWFNNLYLPLYSFTPTYCPATSLWYHTHVGTHSHYLQNITHFSNIFTLLQEQKNVFSLFSIIELKVSSSCVKYFQKLHTNLTYIVSVQYVPLHTRWCTAPSYPILHQHTFSIIIPPLQVANNFKITSSSVI